MYDINKGYTVTTTLYGKHVSTHDFNGKADAVAWFKKASTDPEWFGPGFRVVLRHRGRVLKQTQAVLIDNYSRNGTVL